MAKGPGDEVGPIQESTLFPGEVPSIFVRRGCAVFQGIAFAYFSKNGVSKDGNFLEPVVKTG